MMKPEHTRNTELWVERAKKVLPGKQSNLKRGVGNIAPIILDHAKGVKYWDVDNNDYIDFILGIGPALMGHGNPAIDAAIRRQMERLTVTSSSQAHTTLEIELGEKIVEHLPSAEMVRFAISGTEANQAAIRLARAYTQRPYFVRFDRHFHGSLDNVYCGGVSLDQIGSPFPIPSDTDSSGLGPGALRESFILPWNNIDILEKVLEQHSSNVCMVMMEPILCNYGCCHPVNGYLERVRELCTKHGIVLAFDEVVTGFRVGLSGAQGLLGVTPDLTILGKALGGGLPLAAVCGKRDIMQLLREDVVLVGGTFNAFPLAMASGLETIELMEADKQAYFKAVDRVQGTLVSAFKDIGREHEVPLLIQGPRSVFHCAVSEFESVSDPQQLENPFSARSGIFRRCCIEAGLLVAPGNRFFISGYMTTAEIDEAIVRFDQAISQTKANLLLSMA